MRKWYQFGHTVVETEIPEGMRIPENMKLFEISCGEPEKVCVLEFAEDLAAAESQFRAAYPDAKEILRKNMRILTASGRECRILNFEGAKEPYAVYIEESPEKTHTRVSPSVYEMLQFDTIFVSLLGLEKVMIRRDALILHSAYVCRDKMAVLFSAPSGTGKSTQADLWERYRGTRTINGDKSLLIREADGWYAYGWPICGSSGICYNETYPIRAIVMLRQAKANAVRRLGVPEAVKKLFSQITINMWNAEFQIQAMDLIQCFVSEVPVYELECDISENAVACLERVLYE